MITILLAERDAELGQLRKTIEQIQQEKAKESERANKLAEELKGGHLLVGVTVEVLSLLNGTLQCLETTVRGSRHSLMCWSKRLGPRGTSLTP